MYSANPLFEPLDLPNGKRLKNRLVKSAMSDMLGDGRGRPTEAQRRLYTRWAKGGIGASIIGEVQGSHDFPEASGNLVLNAQSDRSAFRVLAEGGKANGADLWLQLGHAGALAPKELGVPAGPSKIDLPELKARELSLAEIKALPEAFARTARLAMDLGFGGVQIHAAHGFLLSQFLSPLFNRRTDAYGGSVQNRMRLLLETVYAVRDAVRSDFTVALKLNSSDSLIGGLEEVDALKIVAELDSTGLDLIDISGGTYFPGAPASSERSTSGPYFLDFAVEARPLTSVPLMMTGGIKRKQMAEAAIASGAIDAIGLARALILNPFLPRDWMNGSADPEFPSFTHTVPGGVTAWYTRAIKAIAEGMADMPERDMRAALKWLETVKSEQTAAWRSVASHSLGPGEPD